MTTTVLIVDESQYVRNGLRLRLELIEGVEVVGGTGSTLEALRLAKRLLPDLIILDLDMGEETAQENTVFTEKMAGRGLLLNLKAHAPLSRMVIYTVHADPAGRQAAYAAGVSGFFIKGQDDHQLLAEIINYREQKNQSLNQKRKVKKGKERK